MKTRFRLGVKVLGFWKITLVAKDIVGDRTLYDTSLGLLGLYDGKPLAGGAVVFVEFQPA